MDLNQFYSYVLSFYGSKSEVSPEYSFTLQEIKTATKQYIDSDAEFCADSVDRERIRDIVLKNREVYDPYRTVNS